MRLLRQVRVRSESGQELVLGEHPFTSCNSDSIAFTVESVVQGLLLAVLVYLCHQRNAQPGAGNAETRFALLGASTQLLAFGVFRLVSHNGLGRASSGTLKPGESIAARGLALVFSSISAVLCDIGPRAVQYWMARMAELHSGGQQMILWSTHEPAHGAEPGKPVILPPTSDDAGWHLFLSHCMPASRSNPRLAE